jgi:hypothetical protein
MVQMLASGGGPVVGIRDQSCKRLTAKLARHGEEYGTLPLPGTRTRNVGQMNPYLAAYLAEHAGWLVFSAWLLTALVVLAGLPFAIVLGVADFYGDPQLVYPIHRVIVSVIMVAAPASLIVAAPASIAFAMDHRFVTSALVGSMGLALIGGSVVALVLTPRGPLEMFEYYVGDQRFLLPSITRRPTTQM